MTITVPANRNYTANLTDAELLRRLKNYHGRARAIAGTEISAGKVIAIRAIGNEYHRATGEDYTDAIERLVGLSEPRELDYRVFDLLMEWMRRETEKVRQAA